MKKDYLLNLFSLEGKVALVTGAIIWLCSDTAAYANGTDILIDGLYTAV